MHISESEFTALTNMFFEICQCSQRFGCLPNSVAVSNWCIPNIGGGSRKHIYAFNKWTSLYCVYQDLQALKPLTTVTTKFIQFADKISFAGYTLTHLLTHLCIEATV